MEIRIKHIAKSLLIAAAIGLGISYGPIYLFHLLAFVFVLFFIVKGKKNISFLPLNIKITNVFFILIAFISWNIVSILWAVDKNLSLYYVFYLVCGLLIIIAGYTAVKEKQDLLKLIKAFGLIIGIEILIAFLESFTSFRYPISPYSDLVVYFNREIAYNTSLAPEIIAAIKNTPTGFRWNPNNLAVSMILVIPFFLFQKRIYLKLLGSISAIAVILLTGSRGTLIAIAFMFIFYFIFYIKKRERIIVSAILGFLILVFFLNARFLENSYSVKTKEISTTVSALENYLFTNHESVNDTSSIAIRQNLINNGMHAFYNSYGLGVGAGNSVRIQKKHDNTHHTYSMHNFWVEILVEGGIIAFCLFVYFYVFIIIKLIRIFKKENSDFENPAKATSLSLIGFSVGMISISSAVYFLPMWIIFSLALVIIHLEKQFKKN